MPIRKSGISGGGIPFGQNQDRPANPELGQPFFNADESRLELYTTATGWQNVVQETPGVVNISGTYLESQATNTIIINGTNFASGATAFAIGTNSVEVEADSASVISVVQVNAVFSGLSKEFEPYDIKVVNPSNLYGILYDSLQIDDTPVWNTQSGSLGSFVENSAVSISVSVSEDEGQALIFSVYSGSLPPGLSINSGNGTISGTAPSLQVATSPETYSFTLDAFDGANHSYRNFSITITDDGPVWITGTNLPAFSKDVLYSQSLLAEDPDQHAVTYSLVAGTLPSGLVLNSSNGEISGTPSSLANTTFTIRATDSVTSAYSDKQFILKNSGPTWPSANSVALGTNSSTQLSATDDSGVTPTYSLISGSLPAGVALSSSGLLSSGASENSSTVVIRATDSTGEYTDKTLTIIVSNAISVSGHDIAGNVSGQYDGYNYYKINVDTTLTINNPANRPMQLIVVGAGGHGNSGSSSGPGGGAGALYYNSNFLVTSGTYSIVIGQPSTFFDPSAGGLLPNSASTRGGNTTAFGITAYGGASGGADSTILNNIGSFGAKSATTAADGGSGASYYNGGDISNHPDGTGVSPVGKTVVSGLANYYGNNSGDGFSVGGAGGGGAGGAGGNAISNASSGNGGDGMGFNWTGFTEYLAAGGGGGGSSAWTSFGIGGSGVGGNGGGTSGTNAVANTGSGGGGAGSGPAGRGSAGTVWFRALAPTA